MCIQAFMPKNWKEQWHLIEGITCLETRELECFVNMVNSGHIKTRFAMPELDLVPIGRRYGLAHPYTILYWARITWQKK